MTDALAWLWAAVGGEPAALERVTLTGADPLLPTAFKIGTAASAVIGASALAAAELWRLRTGRGQSVALDLRAAVAAFRSERYLRVNGEAAPDVRGPIFGFYRTRDLRFIQLHSAMPHHREALLAFLGVEGTREAVATAVAKWAAEDLEDALAAQGLPAGLVRSRAEWQAHPQGQAVATLPLLEILRIGDAPPEPAGAGPRPLSGVRVLDLTRVIAGPVCGRALASHGADVLRIANPHLDDAPAHVMDIGAGKLSAVLDLRHRDDADRLRGLVSECDVFCQSFRPGALARFGFGPEDLARRRPGLVYVTLSAYGHLGPWRDRRGFETLIQSVSGMAHEHGLARGLDRPQHLPAQVVDHGSGYLAALGALVALARRAREGGSYLVRVSLAQTGRWVDALGRVDDRHAPELSPADVDDLLVESMTLFGRLRHVRPAARLSETPAAWSRPAVPPGTHGAGVAGRGVSCRGARRPMTPAALGLLAVGLAACATGSTPARVAPESLLASLGSGTAPVLVDVRTRREYDAGHIPGAVSAPFHTLLVRQDGIRGSRARPIVVYCEHGSRAGIAKLALRLAGFSDVRYLDGHMSGWKARGLPIERN